jgi:DNA-binding response OmpR family regulator
MTAPTSGLPSRRAAVILVVEDDPQVRKVVCEALSEDGLDVLEAADGREAIERARDQPPALVVLDVTLPVVDGYRVAADLCVAYGAALPILVMSADGQIREKAQRVGAYAYLRKPFDLDVLLAAVRSGLEAR